MLYVNEIFMIKDTIFDINWSMNRIKFFLLTLINITTNTAQHL